MNKTQVWLRYFEVDDLTKIGQSDKFLDLLDHPDFDDATFYYINDSGRLQVFSETASWQWETPGGPCVIDSIIFQIPERPEPKKFTVTALETREVRVRYVVTASSEEAAAHLACCGEVDDELDGGTEAIIKRTVLEVTPSNGETSSHDPTGENC